LIVFKQSFYGLEGIAVADRFIAMDGQVADFLDGEDLGEEAPSTPLRDRATIVG
jgi:hypothetical protein